MAEENTEATAERPAMSEEERQQLNELKAKEAAEAKAAAEEAAADAAAAEELRKEEIANRPLFHVLVRHMARNPRTRTMRAARAGHRRQGVLLDDGTRIRKQGRRRYTEVDLRELANNHNRLLEYVRVGAIEVCDPKGEQAIPYGDLVELIKKVGAWVVEQKYAADMEAWEKAMAQYEEDHNAWKEAAKEAKKNKQEPPPEPEAPPKPEAPESGEMEVDESGLQQDPVEGSEHEENAAPPPPPADPDTTRPDMGQGAVMAAVDQHEAEANGEANSPSGDTGLLEDDGSDAGSEEESGEDEGLTEEELLKMKLEDLKTLATDTYGCDEESVSKMRAKKDVVEAIFEASAEGEE